MITIDKTFPNSGNAYVLFGWDAEEARPNCDPYTGALRIKESTNQVYTSGVHLKAHIRRGMIPFALETETQLKGNLEKANAAVFYSRFDEDANTQTKDNRLEKIRKVWNLEKGDKYDAMRYCVDTPLFGYTHTVTKESYSTTNACTTLYRPSTFHPAEINYMGTSNAFYKEDGSPSGGATVDVLEYGYFFALLEINLSMLVHNLQEHKILTKSSEAMEFLVNGLWKAYTSDRFPSITQRSQFAHGLVGWIPKKITTYSNPAKSLFTDQEITNRKEAVEAFREKLKIFLKNYDCTKETTFCKANDVFAV